MHFDEHREGEAVEMARERIAQKKLPRLAKVTDTAGAGSGV